MSLCDSSIHKSAAPNSVAVVYESESVAFIFFCFVFEMFTSGYNFTDKKSEGPIALVNCGRMTFGRGGSSEQLQHAGKQNR